MKASPFRFSSRSSLLLLTVLCCVLALCREYVDSRSPLVVRWPSGNIRGIYELRFDVAQNAWVTNSNQVEFRPSGAVFRQACMRGIRFRSAVWEMKMDMYDCPATFLPQSHQVSWSSEFRKVPRGDECTVRRQPEEEITLENSGAFR